MVRPLDPDSVMEAAAALVAAIAEAHRDAGATLPGEWLAERAAQIADGLRQGWTEGSMGEGR